MPLTKIQSDVLRLLASKRDPESYMADSTPLNRNASRYSNDIDIFHDREERVREAAEKDAGFLEENGFTLQWHRREPLIYTVFVGRPGESTRLEWVVDSDYRFFPTIPDAAFGYILHPADLATNKVAAAYGRREPRDVVDLITVHERILPLGAAIWASVGKSLGFTPEGAINWIRRTARYSREEFNRVASEPPVDPEGTMIRLRELLDEAEAFVARMPTEKAGLLFLENDKVVQPDPDHLERYETHGGQRRGHWPDSGEISSAMIERYSRDSSQ